MRQRQPAGPDSSFLHVFGLVGGIVERARAEHLERVFIQLVVDGPELQLVVVLVIRRRRRIQLQQLVQLVLRRWRRRRVELVQLQQLVQLVVVP